MTIWALTRLRVSGNLAFAFGAVSPGEGPRKMPTTLSEPVDLGHIKTCRRCGQRYDWRRSPSTCLKMTYCGSLCERADLGFTIEALVGPVEPAAPARHFNLLAA
jgi:hypothetical protein